ncbi:MAG: DNA-formamidopyrimidine glycosylase [Planctomycetota bacterium]|nr:MAG: DNA-formamidopyrimidine glycosylase [Planctomycetota bacterium]
MPELPEVESVRRVLAPEIEGRELEGALFRRADLRWPMPQAKIKANVGQRLLRIQRRGKYLIFLFERGAPWSFVAHLGMSGKLLLDEPGQPRWRLHEHYRLRFAGRLLRYVDPRRFGALLVAGAGEEHAHPLLAKLGPDPFEAAADADWLFGRAQGRSASVKCFLLDSRVIAGVGNIYANEALFAAGIDPRAQAGNLGRSDCQRLLAALRQVMAAALEVGGTTLRDHVDAHGEPGWFQLQLAVYGRAGQPCHRCGGELVELRQSGRQTCFCPACQRQPKRSGA